MDFSAIDWQQPWLEPLRNIGRLLATSADWLQTANHLSRERGLTNLAGKPVVFVSQDTLPDSLVYEAHIHATGQVPTRDNLHDFFNALIWLHFPQTKRTLNQLQAQEIQRRPETELRGPQRDAATLFDENAALFVCSDPSMIRLLTEHQWKSLLLDDPERFARKCRVILFGHALLEKLVHPYKAITAHVWCMSVDGDVDADSGTSLEQLSALDASLTAAVAPGFVSRDFCHLPVLGVPGWWKAQDESFYNDTAVFRPPRMKRPAVV